METAIISLLNSLEAAEQAGAPLNDTVIREAMVRTIEAGFFEQVPGYRVPSDLLLNYTAAAAKQNADVVKAFEVFLREANLAAKRMGLKTLADREKAFRQSEVYSTSEEVNVESYFE